VTFNIYVVEQTWFDFHQILAPDGVFIVLEQESKVRVHGLYAVIDALYGGGTVQTPNGVHEVADGPAGAVSTAWHDYRPGEFHALRIMLEVEFLLVELQPDLSKLRSDARNGGQEDLLVLVDEISVVHISAMVWRDGMDKPVEIVQIEVGKYLTEQVADGDATSFLVPEERLMVGQLIKELQPSLLLAIQLRLV
jgi:hypothetical protein